MKRNLKIKKLLLTLAVVSALFAAFSTSAFADDDLPTAGEAMSSSSTSASSSSAKPQEAKEYDFDGDDVQGNLLHPDGQSITGDQSAGTINLIELRPDFIDELNLSLDSI